jgi:serine/threonine-protein kinase
MMTDDQRVQQLLDELEDSDATPEEVCEACPDLLPVVRDRWRRMRRVRADLDALFPPLDKPIPERQEESGLPQIPGYEVQAVLGRGGAGIVFRARHLKLNRLVALKMILSGAYAEPRELARFLREAEAVAGLRHPNIVQLHDMGENDGRPYFTMEYVEGGSLAQKLMGTPQCVHFAAAWTATLADAVQVAHQGGIIHRDLKPANILLQRKPKLPIPDFQTGTPNSASPSPATPLDYRIADYDPKIADFGLARHFERDSVLTQSGTPVGTPSYMAPEQAMGKTQSIGPLVDVYSLGAVLYELLTGRPPFRGESPAETLLQVIHHDPVPPSRLNPKVPRDLETICLKCLEKEPARRYATAAAMADDLRRLEEGRPILARPMGWPERSWRWCRRKPAAAGLLAAGVLLVAAGAVGGWMIYQQEAAADAHQAQIDLEVRGVVERASSLLEEGWQAADLAKLTEARADGNRAVDMARSGGAGKVVQQEAESFQEYAALRLDRAQKDRALLDAVLDVAAPQETSTNARDQAGRPLVPARPSLDMQYSAAFRHWGLDVDSTAEAELVERLREEPDVVVQELIAGLDAWMIVRRRQHPEGDWRRLFLVAEHLDRSDRRRQLRSWLVGGSSPRAEAVAGLVAFGSPWPALWDLEHNSGLWELLEVRMKMNPRTEPVLTVVLLAEACAAVGNVAGAEEVLRQAVATRPDQAVLNHALGKLLERHGPARLEEAIGYYRAARAKRTSLGIALGLALASAGRWMQGEEVLKDLAFQQPDNSLIYYYLGVNFAGQRKLGAAEAAYRQVLNLNPDDAGTYVGLGLALAGQGKHSEAEAAYHKAINLKPDFVEAYNNLGIVLFDQGKNNEAERAFRKAIDLKPDAAQPYYNLGNALTRQGKRGAAEAFYRKAIDIKPDYFEAYDNLGNRFYERRQYREAEAAYRKAIDLKPDSAGTHNNLGNVLFGQGKHDEAVTEYGKAIALQPAYAEAHRNLGNVLYERQRYDEAEAAYRKAINFKPDFGLAYHDHGFALAELARFHEAAASLKKGLDLIPAGTPQLEQARRLLQQCLRLASLDDRLPMILKGTEKPANLSEQTEFAQLCCFKKLYAAGARLYADAFAMQPQLAEDDRTGFRYRAACAAARAAAGEGHDGARLDKQERAGLRGQALAWLRADLALRTRQLRSGESVGTALVIWQTDTALSGVRDRAAVATLPADERESWQRLWEDVEALRAADPLAVLEEGRTHAAHRRWAKAADSYARVLKDGHTSDGHVLFEYAALLLLTGDRAGNAKTCADMIEKCGKNGGPRAYHVARACTLAPDAVAEAALPDRLAAKELQDNAREFWSLTEQGALAYRAGKFQESVPLFEQSLRANSKPGAAVLNRLWLAMANLRLEKPEEARRDLSKGQAFLDQYRDGIPARAEEELGLHYHNWLEAHVLHREVETLIPQKSPPVEPGSK